MEVESSLKALFAYVFNKSRYGLRGLFFLLQGTPVIYVNFNYRLGPLGFPQGQEAQNEYALNLGIKDQITALDWGPDAYRRIRRRQDKVIVKHLGLKKFNSCP
jgi:hypothetical protein